MLYIYLYLYLFRIITIMLSIAWQTPPGKIFSVPLWAGGRCWIGGFPAHEQCFHFITQGSCLVV